MLKVMEGHTLFTDKMTNLITQIYDALLIYVQIAVLVLCGLWFMEDQT